MLFKTIVERGKTIESIHNAKCLVKDKNYKNLLSSNNDKDYVYPRSAIKIFQALPFIVSGAHKKYSLNHKQLAIACSSHCGENFHISVLSEWIKKINLSTSNLKCGIHNPINIQSSNKLLLTGKKPSELYNNCSGKHLAMLSGCLAKNFNISGYLNLSHPYQKLIRSSLEYFTEHAIEKNNIGIDGCSAPQYSFPMENLSRAMVNLVKKTKTKNKYSNAVSLLLKSISENPKLIGGTNRFDTEIIKITKGRIFCKGGAEGVLLFADTSKNFGGIIKIIDGNERAIPSVAIEIFIKLKMLLINEKKYLKKWSKKTLYNHANKKIGKIYTEIMV